MTRGDGQVSVEELNAFNDGELDVADEARVLAALREDPALAREVSELGLTKRLVRNAYRGERPARHDRWQAASRGGLLAAAAIALVVIGAGAGWSGRALLDRGDDDFSRFVRQSGTLAQVASDRRVLLHFSSSAPDRVAAMLDETEAMLRAARKTGRPIAIEIVANNTGLDVLRTDRGESAQRLAALAGEFPELTLVACAQTLERLRERGVTPRLLPQATVASSALDQVVKRIHEGWTYVRA